MKPRFRAEWVVVSEELLILASCLLRPMSRNSVLEELRVRRFVSNSDVADMADMAARVQNLSFVVILPFTSLFNLIRIPMTIMFG